MRATNASRSHCCLLLLDRGNATSKVTSSQTMTGSDNSWLPSSQREKIVQSCCSHALNALSIFNLENDAS